MSNDQTRGYYTSVLTMFLSSPSVLGAGSERSELQSLPNGSQAIIHAIKKQMNNDLLTI